MKNKIFLLICLSFFLTKFINAQVQVSAEPRHHPVLQNKYIRLLDVWLPPGDTTMFHIHSTPSLFVVLSGAFTAYQTKDEEWIMGYDSVGKSWYRSFSPDILIHRVSNVDKVPFHVNDIELLAPYNEGNFQQQTSLPFPVIFENERVINYQLKKLSGKSQIIQHRGPVVAELVKGDGVVYHDVNTKKTKSINQGSYLYIEPEASFYFSAPEHGAINLLLFELK